MAESVIERRLGQCGTAVALGLGLGLAPVSIGAGSLETNLGRNETRVWSEPVPVPPGRTVAELALDERLDRLGYRRVHRRPEIPGEYFHGDEVYWVFRRACHAWGKDHGAELIGLALDPDSGRIVGLRLDDGSTKPLRGEGDIWLEPELLSESLSGDRADREPVVLAELPEHVWRAVLAAEDARFFSHPGLDTRALARAALRNLKQGQVVEGGSTITQQLVKNRDLSPKRSLGRKANEALRALALEEEYDKEEILQAYLNSVYMGHVHGLAVHGLGTAARVFFSRDPSGLSLAEASSLAAMIQGPNRLSPLDDADALRTRRDWVLGRMEELGWASPAEVADARSAEIAARPSPPRRSVPVHYLGWVRDQVEDTKAKKVAKGRGFLVETTVDPLLQSLAQDAVDRQLERLRRAHPRLRRLPLRSALIALDARSGAVLASVGGPLDDPPGAFDRVRMARRQPGSVVKPFVALEALAACGGREPLTASSRIADRALRIDLPSGVWEPHNNDGRYRGEVTLRETLAESRNVPTVRIARWCGFGATAGRFRRLRLELPADPPPSFVLGAVEATPLDIARAFTVLATPGRILEPYPVRRLETSGGRGLERWKTRADRVADPAAAYLVRDLLRTAVEEGTAAAADLPGLDVAAKTGSSSDLRDAWFAGHAGSLVTVVWVGLDGGERMGLTGAAAAGPIWRDFMVRAVPARPPFRVERPRTIVQRWVEPETGLLVPQGREGARLELYRDRHLPPRRRWWKSDLPVPVVE